ncbi:unnamed protein product [Nezara viridula]|uniref:Uncharacterized protein n=1 Tax=Nezara viridula TaxID=85310 RepID=A0A9P0E8J2_NEZVI|nr:unnamed protein product [Nezara viridula]
MEPIAVYILPSTGRGPNQLRRISLNTILSPFSSLRAAIDHASSYLVLEHLPIRVSLPQRGTVMSECPRRSLLISTQDSRYPQAQLYRRTPFSQLLVEIAVG